MSPPQAGLPPGWYSWDSDLGKGLQGFKGSLLCPSYFVPALFFTCLYPVKPLVWGSGGDQLWP